MSKIRVIAENPHGDGTSQVIVRLPNGKLGEANLGPGMDLEKVNWQKVQPQDPANFGNAMYRQGQGWAFIAYCAAMTPFFTIAYLLVSGKMQWKTVELLGQICGIPAFLFVLVGMPIIIAIKKRNEHPYQ